ncbi:T9SS type A sorting domain-containing protein [uncultured Maribacter sp.]|uniref:T9SS type A sorting domain-containing protein n=1 Tax=uncultured Maribacter sp. TaxID=431308 RepID=UPI002628EF43|nr:T9SS type A sorting domain-containing protein [uncultured Maribacter sp.]
MRIIIVVFLFFTQTGTFLFGQITPNELGGIPNSVSETSGLLFYNNKIITHNDSGNLPQLYEIDTLSIAVTRTVNISNATNVDWEDIAQDDSYMYIGDIGNNIGVRKDLVVYRISKEDYNAMDTVVADRITFKYEDQLNFVDSGNSDWDAEAMFVFENQLIILTKQWKSEGTVAYVIPSTPGEYSATKLDSYSTNGLITGASYTVEENLLMLVGYTKTLIPFLYRIKGISETSIFSGEITELNLNVPNVQVEGVTYISENRWFFSTETFRNRKASLFAFSLKENEDTEELLNSKSEMLLYYNQEQNKLFYELPSDADVFGRAVYDVAGKCVSCELENESNTNFVDISGLKSAVYYMTIYSRDKVFSKPFIKY